MSPSGGVGEAGDGLDVAGHPARTVDAAGIVVEEAVGEGVEAVRDGEVEVGPPGRGPQVVEIGRASCRERV